MKRAFIFPGQGSQAVGMGKALYDNFAAARAVFQEVDEALKESLSKTIFEGPAESLTLTHVTQPALMTVSIAVVRVIESETKKSLAELCDFVAGHSLGEYSALVAAGSLPLGDAARLLRARGEAMQAAVAPGVGAMAAIFPVEMAIASEIAKKASNASEFCDLANDNGGGQMVVSGHAAAIDRAIADATARGIKRAVKLAVSAPFHCRLMAPAAAAMESRLQEAPFSTPEIPVVTNVTAYAVTDVVQIRKLLVEQIASMVRWRESVEYLATAGVTQAIELGAGKVLSGLVKRINPDINSSSIGTPDEINSFINQL